MKYLEKCSRQTQISIQLTVLASGCLCLIFLLFTITKSRVKSNKIDYLRASLNLVLPTSVALEDFDNDVAKAPKYLDQRIIYPACKKGAVRYALVEIETSKGYSGAIRLLVNIDQTTKRVVAVRPLFHQETPGLGDQMDVDKSDWLGQLAQPLATESKKIALRQDGGDIDAMTGATITSRAVTQLLANQIFSKSIPADLCKPN